MSGKSERFTWRPEHIDTTVALFDPNQPRDDHGRFGSGGSGETRVGITSARPGTSNRDVFKGMKQFDTSLRALPGVSDVHVEPGVGAWQGGGESTWVVSYKGNGAATKLLAETGKRYNQDAVLVMRAGGKDASPVVDLKFDKPVSSSTRDAIGQVMAAHGIGGWTWLKSGGSTVLRSVSVPQWGSTAQGHLDSMKAISAALKSRGLGHTSSVGHVAVDVMERSGTHSYDAVIGGK